MTGDYLMTSTIISVHNLVKISSFNVIFDVCDM